MTSKERINKLLSFQRPDRIGINDIFLDSTLDTWKREGLPKDISPHEYFGLDFNLYNLEDLLESKTIAPDKDKFTVISFSEPFQRFADMDGLENTLRRLAAHPKDTARALSSEADRIIDSFSTFLKGPSLFDGVWAWGDLAYDKGLLFSVETYKNIILPLHKRLFQFFNSRSLPIFFHSDGNIKELMPHLIDAGVKAIHPFEERCNGGLDKLVNEYGQDVVFMGGMDIEEISKDRDPMGILKKKIDTVKKDSFYIYQAGHPIMPNISFKDYNITLDTLKNCGRY